MIHGFKYIVTAIVSVYNCERFIRGCLEDLEAQTIADHVEIICVNSGSQQNEEVIIREFQEKYKNIIYIKTKKRETIYGAWNRGIKVARGKYITNANSDDRHRKDAFEIAINVLEEHHDVGLVYYNYIETMTENEVYERCTPSGYLTMPDYEHFELLFRSLPAHQPMWRRCIHNEIGYFNDKLEVAGDREFWLRIATKYNLKHINEYLGLYLKRYDSLERMNSIATTVEIGDVVDRYIDNIYIPSLAHQHESKRKVRIRQSDEAFYRGDFFYLHKQYELAREALIRSCRYNLCNLKSYQLLLACYLPDLIVSILRKIKRSATRGDL